MSEIKAILTMSELYSDKTQMLRIHEHAVLSLNLYGIVFTVKPEG